MNADQLEELQLWHTDSFGWALTQCNWKRDMAEDILQDAYLKCIDGRANFAGKSTLKTWFFGVIRLTALEHHRKAARRNHLSLIDEHKDEDLTNNPDTALQDSDETRLLLKCLKLLPERQRQIAHLVFYQDMTLEDAAHTMDISIGTARTHYHRCKQNLAKLLNMENGYE